MPSLTVGVLEGVEVRIKALVLLIGSCSGSLTALLAAEYSPKEYPAVKLLCVLIGITGIICGVWASNSKPIFKNVTVETPKNTDNSETFEVLTNNSNKDKAETKE